MCGGNLSGILKNPLKNQICTLKIPPDILSAAIFN